MRTAIATSLMVAFCLSLGIVWYLDYQEYRTFHEKVLEMQRTRDLAFKEVLKSFCASYHVWEKETDDTVPGMEKYCGDEK